MIELWVGEIIIDVYVLSIGYVLIIDLGEF